MDETASWQFTQFFRRIRLGPQRLGSRAMPWLMRTGMKLSVPFVAVWLPLTPLAAFNLGTYTINDRYVSGRYFLTHVYPILLPFMGLAAAIAYGYWTERLWARPLPIFFWLAVDCVLFWDILTGEGTKADNLAVAIWGVLYVVVAVWYCFYKRSVAEYYRALERAYGENTPLTADVAGA